MERKKKKNKIIHTYKKNARTCVLPWIFFPFTLVTVRNATEEMLLLCCVLLFLHSDMIVAHTSLWCLRGKLSWGKFFLEQRLFRRHSSHPFVSQQSRHNLKSISFRDSALNLFHLFTLCTYVFVTSYSRNENIYKRKCYTTIKNRIVQDRFLFEKI